MDNKYKKGDLVIIERTLLDGDDRITVKGHNTADLVFRVRGVIEGAVEGDKAGYIALTKSGRCEIGEIIETDPGIHLGYDGFVQIREEVIKNIISEVINLDDDSNKFIS